MSKNTKAESGPEQVRAAVLSDACGASVGVPEDGATTQYAGVVAADLAQLMRFYEVDSLAELIEAQEKHIAKLQAKLRDATPLQRLHTRVREG